MALVAGSLAMRFPVGRLPKGPLLLRSVGVTKDEILLSLVAKDARVAAVVSMGGGACLVLDL